MINILGNSDDTITAVATPPGASDSGIIRVSGADAFRIANEVFSSDSGEIIGVDKSWRSAAGEIAIVFSSGERPLKCTATALVMPGPRSYTRQDVVEFLLPGSPPIIRAVLADICRRGARHAEAGEFTFRAFLNGRINLGQAEAVEQLVAAESEAERRAALSRLEGGTAQAVEKWLHKLLEAAATIEAILDFENDEFDEDPSATIASELEKLAAECLELASKSAAERPDRDGVHIAFVGLTNAGKSSLANALAGDDRAIVSPEASTTRDRLAREILVDGVRFILEDTPGFDPAGDPLGRRASERNLKHIDSVTLACFVIDASRPVCGELEEFARKLKDVKLIVVLNKTDLGEKLDDAKIRLLLPDSDIIQTVRTSAVSGEGIGDLKTALLQIAMGDLALSHGGRISAREAMEMERAAGFCRAASELLRTGAGLELASEELRAAHQSLARVLGQGYAEDVLESIFSRFCIGK